MVKEGYGVLCPNCGSNKLTVVDIHMRIGRIRRVYKCSTCDERVVTLEYHEDVYKNYDCIKGSISNARLYARRLVAAMDKLDKGEV